MLHKEWNKLQITSLKFKIFTNYSFNVYFFLLFKATKVLKSTAFKPNHSILIIKMVGIMCFGLNAVEFDTLVSLIYKKINIKTVIRKSRNIKVVIYKLF